jgi:hypothetical protein
MLHGIQFGFVENSMQQTGISALVVDKQEMIL